MPHSDRPMMIPQSMATFDQIYTMLLQCRGKECTLMTTGGVEFVATAATAQRVNLPDKRFISLPHNNRIYSCCWGNQSNHMGNEGQRIGQYSRPLDEWATNSGVAPK